MTSALRGSWAPLALAAFVLSLPLWSGSDYQLHMAITIGLFAIAALGARLLMLVGLWSFGQGAFLTLGSYTAALCVTKWSVSFWVGLLLAGVVAGAAAAAIGYPALRIKGVYFAIFTMVLVFAVRETIIVTPGLTNGAEGITGLPAPDPIALAGLDVSFVSRTPFYYLVAVLFLVAFATMRAIDGSRVRLVLDGIRQNEMLASALGVKVVRYRLGAFVLACGFAGLAGAVGAPYYATAHPEIWGLWPSIFIIVYAIVGGVGSSFGPVIGAAASIYAVELLRATEGLQVILLGAGLMVVMFLLPGGLVSLVSRERGALLMRRLVRREG